MYNCTLVHLGVQCTLYNEHIILTQFNQLSAKIDTSAGTANSPFDLGHSLSPKK